GIAPDLRIDRWREARQSGDERFHHRQRSDAAIGDDQRTLDTVCVQVLGDEVSRAGAEMNRRRKSKARHGHLEPLPSKGLSPICTKRSSSTSFGHCATFTSGRIAHVSSRLYKGMSSTSSCRVRTMRPTSYGHWCISVSLR